nr:hypothetical protein [uncultured Pseudomonas sp.]
MQIACVLKSGPEYGPDHLYRMVETLLAHNPAAQVLCLTDCEIDHPRITAVPLLHGWEGWWSKIELFRPGVITEPTLYLDIDTVVIGPLDSVRVDEFTMLANVYHRGDFGSGVMGWTHTPTRIYEQFLKRPKQFMALYRTTKRWGDQAFIRDYLGAVPQTFGSEFRSYKAHCRNGVPAGTKVVYFHGSPRPWQAGIDWMRAHG